MKRGSAILIFSLVATAAALCAGYLMLNLWWIIPAILGIALFGLFTTRFSEFWAASIAFLVLLLLCVLGILSGVSAILMLLAAVGALVSWDLIQFNQNTSRNSPTYSNALLEKNHFSYLALAAIGGTALALAVILFQLQLPFGLLLILALFAIGGLVFAVQYIVKHKNQ